MNAARLELHNVEVAYAPESAPTPREFFVDIRPARRAEVYLGLLTLAVRMAPTWPTVVHDTWDGRVWRRDEWVYGSGGFARGNYSYLPMDRIITWGRLISHWPGDVAASVEQSLSYYYESVVDRPEYPAKALTSAAIAFESLLGRGLRQELSHRLAQRGAHLVAQGSEAERIYDGLKRIYGVRSKLVHEAQAPDQEHVVHLQQFLMRAIPSMARLIELAGSHKKALAVLDAGSFTSQPHLEALFDQNGWWNFADVLIAWSSPSV